MEKKRWNILIGSKTQLSFKFYWDVIQFSEVFACQNLGISHTGLKALENIKDEI